MSKKLTFIDLFAGCGGFSEGFYQEGFESVVHVDFDAPACETIKERMRHYNYSESSIEQSVICGDLTSKEVHKQIDNVIASREIDVLVGGPPCQSFSSVGRAQDKHSMRNDPRNYLFRSYLEILEKHKPKIFVFENVSGLLSAKPNGNYIFPEIIDGMSDYYSLCDNKKTILLNSVHYGVPQIRKRVILIGVRKDLNIDPLEVYQAIEKTHYCPEMEAKNQTLGLKKYLTVKDAIYDLPKLLPGEGKEVVNHMVEKKNAYLSTIRPNSASQLFNHVARKHNDLDKERYRLLSKNKWQLKDLAEVRPDLIHHDPKHFGNRYTVQVEDKPGRTVVAHLYKDGNLFIHPDHKQNRTFTVREAARIQSFPDDFKFVGSRTNQYKQVGNAVPPLMAKQIAKAIKEFIK
ncbi:DNA cytosine methyltransferase [Limibacter armeniacum]|uniref:DNA cytosine methyltransferase n=1 Tax=Limibacter armeniacum TaxID=466084 RepID=UPI002FE57BEC